MGFGDSSLFLKITFILLIVALIIQILGVALPYWIEVSVASADSYQGLWKYCYKFGSYKACANFLDGSNLEDWFRATRALEVIGLLLIIAALVVTIIVVFVKSDMKILKLIGWILSFCACGFIIIGIIVYGADSTSNDFSGAFAITIIAGIFCFITGILGLLDWMGKGK